MDLTHDVGKLPAVHALDSYAVLDGRRRGASIQLDDTYFEGQIRALQSVEQTEARRKRLVVLNQSRAQYDDIEVGLDGVTESKLLGASERFRRELRELPEVKYLKKVFPGECFVLPEWLRTDDQVHYGARVYLFREGDAPAPAEILDRNVESVVEDSLASFERYQGGLHGYPDCCVEFFHERGPDRPAPEWRSVEPLADRIRTDALGRGPYGSIDDVLPGSLDSRGISAFFTREFFPEPGCESAGRIGTAIRDSLAENFPDQVVADFFKINYGVDFLVAQAVHNQGDRRPTPGELGQEHLLFSLPLSDLLSLSRYR